MIKGSCLCGGVCFEIDKAVGPFELCHCSRCRKTSGSAFAATVGVRTADFRLLQGEDLIVTYEAPIVRSPPAYATHFCRRCGSPVPKPPHDAEWFEIAAGAIDDDPGLRPDKHIFVDVKSPWYRIADSLPQFDIQALAELRRRTPKQ